MREEIIPTLIPHAKFGAAQCPGRLYGRIIRKTAGIICDECLQIIRMVPPGDLRQVLDEMELRVKAASGGSEIPLAPRM